MLRGTVRGVPYWNFCQRGYRVRVSPFAENDREIKREGARWRGTVFRWPVAGTPHASNMQIARLKRTYTMTETLGRDTRGEEGSNVRNCTRRLWSSVTALRAGVNSMNVTRVTMECGRIRVVIFPKISALPCSPRRRYSSAARGRSRRSWLRRFNMPTLIGILWSGWSNLKQFRSCNDSNFYVAKSFGCVTRISMRNIARYDYAELDIAIKKLHFFC